MSRTSTNGLNNFNHLFLLRLVYPGSPPLKQSGSFRTMLEDVDVWLELYVAHIPTNSLKTNDLHLIVGPWA